MKKLPVFRSVGEVFSGVTRHYFQLLIASWPSVLAILLLGAFIGERYRSSGYIAALTATADGKPDMEALLAAQSLLYSGGGGAMLVLAFLLMAVMSAVAAVRWHRLVLLGEGAGSSAPVRIFRSEDGTYLWTYLKILVLVMAAAVLVVALIGLLVTLKNTGAASDAAMIAMALVVLAAYFGVAILYMRLSLALPDAAVGRGGHIREVYKASSGNSWRLFGFILLIGLAIILVYAVAIIVVGFVAAIGVGVGGTVLGFAFGVFVYVAGYFYFLMIGITMLSVAYREIVGLPSGLEPDPA